MNPSHSPLCADRRVCVGGAWACGGPLERPKHWVAGLARQWVVLLPMGGFAAAGLLSLDEVRAADWAMYAAKQQRHGVRLAADAPRSEPDATLMPVP